jgi:alanyl-tRNA synthetase
MIVEELQREGLQFDSAAFAKEFDAKFAAHQALSRAGAEQKFAGGLADHSDETRKLHTATHLLHKALKLVLGAEVQQRGSNITAERLRFDFNYDQKMTPEQLKQVEDIVNEQIKRQLPISFKVMTVDEAKHEGAIGLFEEKYGDQVKVYTMGDFSKEICGGPHADNTGDLKAFKIAKEEASSAGVRRIKAVIGEATLK